MPAPQPSRPATVSRDLPRVTVIVLNLNGKRHLGPCFESLAGLDYPRELLEVMLIDNGSEDGSLEEMRARHAWVRLVENEENLGFTRACNQGAQLADRPEVLVFLNNDMRVEPAWLRELVLPIVGGACQSTAAKLLSWDGRTIDSAGGGMNLHGIGIQRGFGEVPGPEHDVPGRTLFACGGAMAIDAGVFREVGGFDEEFFAYYEDVDLGWRLWVQGHEVHYVPTAVCYHHHSSTSGRMPREMIRLLQVRNPLLACFKNYDDANLAAVMGPLFAYAFRRMWIVSGLRDDRAFRIESASLAGLVGVRRLLELARRRATEKVGIRRVAAADLIGINDLLGRFDHWTARREAVQRRRRREDAEIFELFLKPHWCVEEDPGYRELQRGLTRLLRLDERFPPDSIPDPKM